MSLLETFNTCSRAIGAPWITAGLGVQYKVVGGVCYFQQSRGLLDWLLNLLFIPVPYWDGRDWQIVHLGFLILWLSVRNRIKALIEAGEVKQFCGYSQGAFTAKEAHKLFFNLKERQPEGTTLFGCPRGFFFPSDAIKAATSTVVRYESPVDIVANIPPPWMGFEHVSTRIKLTGPIKRQGMSLLAYLSGHAPGVYRQRLARLGEV